MAEEIIRILLVDDDEDDYVLTRDLLVGAGGDRFRLEWVDTHEGAVEVIEREEHDLYLFDYRLGKETGLELLITSISMGIRAPIILLTAQGDHQVDMRAMEMGAYDYLDKQTLNAQLLERSIRYSLERRRVEEALLESEEKLRAITDAAADGIVLMDNDGNISYWNPGAERIFGYRAEEVMGREMHPLLAPEEFHDAYKEGFKQFRETGQGPAIGKTLQFTALRKGGTQFPIEVSISTVPIRGSCHAAGIIRDVSDRKRMEEELLKARKLESIGILAAGFAHDYNNLLSMIMGNLSMAQLSVSPDDEVFKFLTAMEKATIQARDLTEKVVTFAKGGEPIRKPALISPLLKQTVERVLGESDVKYELSIPDDLWPVEIDVYQIGQVIHSLILNAVEAISVREDEGEGRGESGIINLSAENIHIDTQNPLSLKQGKYLKVSIEDNGIGIPEEKRDQVFDPYFSTKERGVQKGMGLGLSICHSIITRHEGNITVKSEEGVGTTFHLYLPALDKDAPEVSD